MSRKAGLPQTKNFQTLALADNLSRKRRIQTVSNHILPLKQILTSVEVLAGEGIFTDVMDIKIKMKKILLKPMFEPQYLNHKQCSELTLKYNKKKI